MDDRHKIKRATNPKESANIFSTVTFFYTKDLLINGYKKDLEEVDLYEVTNDTRSKTNTDKLEHAYAAQAQKSKVSLYKMLWSSYGASFATMGLLNLVCSLVSNAVEPDSISQLVAYFVPGQTSMTKSDAIYYAAVLIGVKLMHALYYPNYLLFIAKLTIQIKAGLSSLVYRKALRLSPKALEKTSLGNIVTIITKDVLQFETGIRLFSEVCIGVISAFYICYLIYSKAGFSALLGTVLLAGLVPIQYYVSKYTGRLRKRMNRQTDVRVQETQEAISAIKIIKMYTWELIFEKRIDESRKEEMKIFIHKSISRVILTIFSDTVGKLAFYCAVMMFISYSVDNNAETIFYLMKSFTSLKEVMGTMFSFGLTYLAELFASVKRIDNVLKLDELPEYVDKPDDEPQIDIRNVSVTLNDKEVLKNISVKLNPGLNIISGHLGSGKSSFIKTILREYPISSGELRSRGRKSYSSQDPWLFPATIRQNILFGEKYDYERYQKVIEVCSLKYDFTILDKGDETIVTDGGMNLSKGQQSRINLARAIYRDSEIYLIDDALTALDTKVQDEIFKECLQGFLKDKLVIFITHNVKHIAQADTLVVLENGEVKFSKTRDEITIKDLKVLEDYPIEHDIEIIDGKQKDEDSSDEKAKLLEAPTISKQVYHEQKKVGKIGIDVYYRYVHFGGGWLMLLLILGFFATSTLTESSSQIMLSNWVNDQSSITGIKDRYFHAVDVQVLFDAYFPFIHNRNFTQTPLVPTMTWFPNGTLFNISETLTPLSYTALTEDQNTTMSLLLELAKLEFRSEKSLNSYSLLIIATIAFEFVKQYSLYKFSVNASVNVHKAMMRSVIFAQMPFFDTFFIGNILNRFSQDLFTADEYLPLIVGLLIGAIFACVGVIAMITSVSLDFLIPALIVVVSLMVIRAFYMPTARSLKRLEAATRSPMVGHLNSSMDGLVTIRAYKAQEILKSEFDKHQDVSLTAKYQSICARGAVSFCMELVATLFNATIIIKFLFFLKDTAAGDVGLALTQAGGLTSILQFALLQWADTETIMTSMERALEFTHVDQENKQGDVVPDWPKKGEVTYQNVSLKYTNTNEKVLKDISFTVKSKEKIGIVGRTGAGKSSIISTLFRLYNHEGTILIDGVDTKKVSLDYLRQNISIIPQDPIMFSGTIRTNIDPLNEFTDEEIWTVLHKVQLDVRVANLDMEVEDTNFSSGERQLLSIARAIVRSNKIVVLDEATANMDPEIEQEVQKVIDKNFASCTVFIVAHRLETILECDKVMVLSRGEIIEFDTPEALIANNTGLFSQMIKNAGLKK